MGHPSFQEARAFKKCLTLFYKASGLEINNFMGLSSTKPNLGAIHRSNLGTRPFSWCSNRGRSRSTCTQGPIQNQEEPANKQLVGNKEK